MQKEWDELINKHRLSWVTNSDSEIYEKLLDLTFVDSEKTDKKNSLVFHVLYFKKDEEDIKVFLFTGKENSVMISGNDFSFRHHSGTEVRMGLDYLSSEESAVYQPFLEDILNTFSPNLEKTS